MIIKATKLHVLITFCFILSTTVQAKDVGGSDTTHLGHDYPRQLVTKKAKLSSVLVEKEYKTLLSRIKARAYPGDKEHIAEIAKSFIIDQKNWIVFRDSHCELKANVYVYPSNSRMWASEFHSCQTDVNEQRIKFLKGISFEFEK